MKKVKLMIGVINLKHFQRLKLKSAEAIKKVAVTTGMDQGNASDISASDFLINLR